MQICLLVEYIKYASFHFTHEPQMGTFAHAPKLTTVGARKEDSKEVKRCKAKVHSEAFSPAAKDGQGQPRTEIINVLVFFLCVLRIWMSGKGVKMSEVQSSRMH